MRFKVGDLLRYNYLGTWLPATVADVFGDFVTVAISDDPDGTVYLDRPVLDLQDEADLAAIAAPF